MAFKSSKNSVRFVIYAQVISLMLIIASFLVHIWRTDVFNHQEIEFAYKNNPKDFVFEIHPRGGVSDSWDKYDVPIGDSVCTLKGCTYEAVLNNYSRYQVTDWKLRINIHDDCYINNAWCGTVEIHQHGAEGEIVQTLDLRNIDRPTVKLSYIPVGQDILIELHDGDYLIYNLNAATMEAPLSAYNGAPGTTSIGFIFYYQRNLELDISDYHGSIRYFKGLLQGVEAKILFVLFLIWCLSIVIMGSIKYAYVKARKEAEKNMALARMKELEEYNKEISEKNSQLEESFEMIRAIADIYYILYSIDLKNNVLNEIKSNSEVSEFLKKFDNITDVVARIPEAMYEEEDYERVRDFFNIENLTERLSDKDNLTDIFHGKFRGWVRTNIIVAKRDEEGKPILILCAVQDVDKQVKEEREQKHRLEEANRIMKSYNDSLNADVETKTAHIKEIQRKVVRGLANVIGNRDMDTVGHVTRTSDVIKIIVDEYMNQNPEVLTKQQADDIVRAAPMHDLGKIYIDTAILCKPGRFTEEEFDKMKMHSTYSGDIVDFVLKDVEESHFVNVAFKVARSHHERWDGKGYPDSLSGGEIPLEARLMALADVYDALVSKRCYKESMSFDDAFKIMKEGMGTQFDPSMESVMLAVRQKLEAYYSQDEK